jgi:hypothetical protein
MSNAKPNEEIITLNGFAEETHYTSDVSFSNIIVPDSSKIAVHYGKYISFKNIKSLGAALPQYHISQSNHIYY